jgi:hypothetical protein
VSFNTVQQEWTSAFLVLFGSLYCNSMVHPKWSRTVIFEYGPPKIWGMKFEMETEAAAKFTAINMRLGLIGMLPTGELYCCNEYVRGIVDDLRQ